MVPMTEVEAEAPLTNKAFRPLLQRLGQILATRFVLVLSVVLFLAAVAVDSFQHQASAADISLANVEFLEMSLGTEAAVNSAEPLVSDLEGTYLEYDAHRARRLRESNLVSARLTHHHLTSAHMFTAGME